MRTVARKWQRTDMRKFEGNSGYNLTRIACIWVVVALAQQVHHYPDRLLGSNPGSEILQG
jgi:hypothetical protein